MNRIVRSATPPSAIPLILAAILACFTAPAAAVPGDPRQGRGVVTGTVRDAVTREPLGSANVILVGTTLGTVSDTAGRYAIGDVPPGEYAVKASLIGFLASTRTDVVVTSARPAVADIALTGSAVEVGGASVEAGLLKGTPELPVSVSRQSSEEIRRQPGGFEDVVRAVSVLPGVARVDAGRNDLIVRGGAPSENLYLLDGIAIPNINHFGTQGSGGGPLSYINLDFVDNTLFSAGGFGPGYGDRLSSVLGIEMREGRRDRLGGKLTLSATQFGLNLEGPTGDRSSFLFSARRSYLDFIFRGAGFGFVPEYWDFTGKWAADPGPSDEIRVVAVAAIDDVNFFNDTDEKRYDNSRILGSSQRQGSGGASWRRLFPDGFLTVTLGQSYVDFSYAQRDTLGNPIFVNDAIERETSIRADLVVRLSGRTTLTAGGEGKLVGFRNDLALPDFVTPFGDTLRAAASGSLSGSKAAGYVQLSGTFGPLTVNAGVRQGRFDLLQSTPPPEPRFSASLALSRASAFNVSVGRYTQSPSYVWLAANPANRSLGAIRADHAVAGFVVEFRPDTRSSLEAFVKRYRGYPISTTQPFLILSNTGAGFGGSEESFSSFGVEPLVGAGSGLSRGFELSLRKRLSEIPFYGLLSLTVGETRYTALDGVERPSAFDQRVIMNLAGGYVPGDGWEIGAKFRLATGRPFTPFNQDGTKSVERFHGERLGTDHSLDLRVDRRWFFDSWTLIAYIDIQNVYNRRPGQAPEFNERTGSIEEDDAIGILPSIGISGEF